MARGFVLHSACQVLIYTFVLSRRLAPAAEERVGEQLYLVRDRPGSPTQFQMIVGAGCNDEKDGVCRGLAHYLEHLVLVGRNPEHKEIALRFFPDGSSNGWTSQRATVYVHTMPAREGGPRADLEKLFEFYAARLKDLPISAEDAERERNVVRQEHDWRVGSRAVRAVCPQARPPADPGSSRRPMDDRHSRGHRRILARRGARLSSYLVRAQQRRFRRDGGYRRRRR